jgi:DHA2 family multidrug resistance protein
MSLPTAPDGNTARLALLATCVLSTLMMTLDTTISNVALPYMESALGASRDQISWVLTSFIAAQAVMTAPVGWLAERFGRRRVFLVCLVGFVASSVLCGASQTVEQLVSCRILQGAFGAALPALSLAILIDANPPQQRARVMAFWGAGVMAGPVFGPVLGGLLTDAVNWRWIFFVNIPLGAIAITMAYVLLGKTPLKSAAALDWQGFGALSAAIVALELLLNRGPRNDWFSSQEIVAEATVALLAGSLFLLHAISSRHCIVPRELFVNRPFVMALALSFVVHMLLLGSLSLVPSLLRDLNGYSVATIGWLMAPRGLALMAGMALAGRTRDHTGSKLVMSVGTVICALAIWNMGQWSPGTSASRVVLDSSLQGFGVGLMQVHINLRAFATMRQELRTHATAVLAIVSGIGAAVGVSTTTTVFLGSLFEMRDRLASFARPFDSGIATQIDVLRQLILARAHELAYLQTFSLMFYLTVALLVLVLVSRKPRAAAD